MRHINMIVVHCSFTKPRNPLQNPRIGVKEIRKWHTDPVNMVDGVNIGGRGWSDIGYHWVIKRDGTFQWGRPLERSGAHARGFNANSIGGCLVGGMDKRTGKPVDDYTPAQWQTLRIVVGGLEIWFPDSVVCGHNDMPNTAKSCPNFDVKDWWGKARNG